MALRGLIENQTIIIDDHRRGSNEIKDWDNPFNDIHIDKTTNYKIKGKRQHFKIRIPINSDRPIKIQDFQSKSRSDLPRQFTKEIQLAFKDRQKREHFIKEIISILRNYSTILENEQRVRQVITNLAKHFGLQWTDKVIKTYVNDVLLLYTQTYKEVDGKVFFLTVESMRIRIGQTNGLARHQTIIR